MDLLITILFGLLPIGLLYYSLIFYVSYKITKKFYKGYNFSGNNIVEKSITMYLNNKIFQVISTIILFAGSIYSTIRIIDLFNNYHSKINIIPIMLNISIIIGTILWVVGIIKTKQINR
jgi:hypothetical protein